MANHIKIGRREFRTKTEVQRHYRSILNDYSLGESLSDTDFNDILDLLTRHPEHEMKIGSGVSHIKVVFGFLETMGQTLISVTSLASTGSRKPSIRNLLKPAVFP